MYTINTPHRPYRYKVYRHFKIVFTKHGILIFVKKNKKKTYYYIMLNYN